MGHVNAYTISFQVWRPNSPSPVDTDGCYTMQGTNHFPSIPLADDGSDDRGIVTGMVPLESERIEVQPGDVVGFYLESSRNTGDGIQFAGEQDDESEYDSESVWYATGDVTSGGQTCLFPVGTGRTLSLFTNLAPLITATVCESKINHKSLKICAHAICHFVLKQNLTCDFFPPPQRPWLAQCHQLPQPPQ